MHSKKLMIIIRIQIGKTDGVRVMQSRAGSVRRAWCVRTADYVSNSGTRLPASVIWRHSPGLLVRKVTFSLSVNRLRGTSCYSSREIWTVTREVTHSNHSNSLNFIDAFANPCHFLLLNAIIFSSQLTPLPSHPASNAPWFFNRFWRYISFLHT